jgi:hypothetical protein
VSYVDKKITEVEIAIVYLKGHTHEKVWEIIASNLRFGPITYANTLIFKTACQKAMIFLDVKWVRLIC